jgi:hypothetical protein
MWNQIYGMALGDYLGGTFDKSSVNLLFQHLFMEFKENS